METITVRRKIVQPDILDYKNKYPRVPCNTEKKEMIFEILTNPANINKVITVVELLGVSPIVIYETILSKAIDRGIIDGISWHEKQFVGTVACVVMESNGWKKTGKKQRFTKGLFRSAEIYIKN